MIKIVDTSPKLLGEYNNGNYKVSIYEDGTKIRETFDENATEFIPEYPECMDVKITNRCDMNCKFCHEDSQYNGEHGEILTAKFWETLKPYTEIALGGGNPLSHPDFVNFLLKLKNLNLIPNVTVNQAHFLLNIPLLKYLCDEKLIYGLGISLTATSAEFFREIEQFPNAVVHVINGVVTEQQLKAMEDRNLKALILGYKTFRRGVDYKFDNWQDILTNQGFLKSYLPEMIKKYSVVSFDNLAIEQLDVKSLMTEDEWNQFYMGDDGKYTMYIDLVQEKYAVSSTAEERFELKDNIKDMFDHVRSISG